MIPSIIKYLFIFFFCIYIYQKSFPTFRISVLQNCVISLIASLTACFIGTYFEGVYYFLPLLLLWAITSKRSLQPQLSFIAIIISFTISFCIYIIASFLIFFITIHTLNKPEHLPIIALLTGVIQAFLIKRIFSIKRFKKGIPFSTTPTFINISTIFCLLLMSLIFYISLDHGQLQKYVFAFFIFIAILAFLIYWWQAQITKSYRRSLELRELESLRTEVVEQNALIQKLLEENEKLARITHRDNTLISTLKNSTVQYLATDFESVEEAKAVRDELIANINTLSEGRSSLPSDYNEKKARDFDTGFSLLDKMLNYMDGEAIKANIAFSVHLGTELKNFVPHDISESDLVHLVDDLLKNAFKSTLTCEKRIVQLQFYKLGKHFVVEVSDNGIPFEVESLVKMGIEKRTTYADGSGIGLMDIWSTKEKVGATYHIEEYEAAAPFSKKISMTFDKKNRYSIRTWRKDEILQMSKRADLQVYGHGE